jgi:ABC-2 type transport system permease protein
MKLVSHARARRVTVWWRRLVVMTRKELLQLLRDIPIVLLLVYSFTAGVYLTGNGVRSQLQNANLLVLDGDRSFSSRELIHKFQAPYFRFEGEVTEPRQGLRALDHGDAMAFLEIPPRFHEQLRTGEPTAVQLLVDTTSAPQGLSAASYTARIIERFGQENVQPGFGSAREPSRSLPVVVSHHRVWYNPEQDDAWFESVSMLLRQITLFAILLPAAAMVREKERGTVEQLLVSPLTPFQIMLAKLLAMTAVILCATAVALFGVARPAFGVPINGSVALFFSLTILFVFTTACLGLAAATLTRNLAQVGLMALLLIAPMFLLSGIVAPMEALPAWARHVMALSPLRYFIEITHGILFKGSGLSVLWDSVLAMTLLGVALFSFSLWRFRRQFR